VQRSWRCAGSKPADRVGDPTPGRLAIVIAGGRKLVGARRTLVECLRAVTLQHQVGGAPNVDLWNHAGKIASLRSTNFNTENCIDCKPTCHGVAAIAQILSAEDVVRRIAGACGISTTLAGSVFA
jgi:hypothetical protein